MSATRITLRLASLLALALTQPLDAQYHPVVGEPHPAFQLPEIRSGKPTSFSDFAGTKVLLIHFASW